MFNYQFTPDLPRHFFSFWQSRKLEVERIYLQVKHVKSGDNQPGSIKRTHFN